MNRKEIQQKLELLDEKLVRLFNQRGRLAEKLERLQSRKSTSADKLTRDEKLLRKITRLNAGPLKPAALRAIYREILSASRDLSGPVRVVYLGPEATFTHAAARKKFGSTTELIPAESIDGVFREIENEMADYGVVPIENSLEGAVTYTLDMFIDSPLKICSEIFLRISHSLLSNSPISRIKNVYSHPQVFGQCRRFIQQNLSHVSLREVSSTAQAAKLAAGEEGSAALAGYLAASVYGLKIIRRDIEDNASNMTRFLVIGRYLPPPTGRDRTSILFSLPHRSGTLHDALSAFKARGINLTKIESRPSRKQPWEYYFFVDLDGHCRSKKVKTALEELEKTCRFMKILGSYPMGKI
ncbi:MAG: prephenate dehydratase [Candidatus Euphemobacter frigidus]|nr:prephenate dehydratase [Candidatus Euphemobacter frigidus]MDP8276583.1 prephenate dehydratase [Candidatus Euphemobacter frigidus]